jgi:beta-aspartyl-peptidase (threonine type)
MSSKAFQVLLHGGAGVISKDNTLDAEAYYSSLKAHLHAISVFITTNLDIMTALEVVEFAVKRLEDDVLFNAGVGSVYTTENGHELEASIMDGQRRCGAASLLRNVKNPISLARVMLEHPYHNYLAGEGAEKLARAQGLEMCHNAVFDSVHRLSQLHNVQQKQTVELDHAAKETENCSKMGTVGCVCMYDGQIAAGTSTGGMTNKLCGRIGDSPVIGAGTYADNTTCAVSCTGVGEEFMRLVAAYDVSARMAYGGMKLSEALRTMVHERLPEDTGGAIAVAASGEYAMDFNTRGMFRASLGSDGRACVGIWEHIESFSWK